MIAAVRFFLLLLIFSLFFSCIEHFKIRNISKTRSTGGSIECPTTFSLTIASGYATRSFGINRDSEDVIASLHNRYINETILALRDLGCKTTYAKDDQKADLHIKVIRAFFLSLMPQEYCTAHTFDMIPVWSTRRNTFIFSFEDTVHDKKKHYHIDRRTYTHLFLIPLSWITFYTANEDRVYQRSLVNFVQSKRFSSTGDDRIARELYTVLTSKERKMISSTTNGEGIHFVPPVPGRSILCKPLNIVVSDVRGFSGDSSEVSGEEGVVHMELYQNIYRNELEVEFTGDVELFVRNAFSGFIRNSGCRREIVSSSSSRTLSIFITKIEVKLDGRSWDAKVELQLRLGARKLTLLGHDRLYNWHGVTAAKKAFLNSLRKALEAPSLINFLNNDSPSATPRPDTELEVQEVVDTPS